MFLDSLSQTLEVSFRVKHGDGYYIVFASLGQLKCFECGMWDINALRISGRTGGRFTCCPCCGAEHRTSRCHRGQGCCMSGMWLQKLGKPLTVRNIFSLWSRLKWIRRTWAALSLQALSFCLSLQMKQLLQVLQAQRMSSPVSCSTTRHHISKMTWILVQIWIWYQCVKAKWT